VAQNMDHSMVVVSVGLHKGEEFWNGKGTVSVSRGIVTNGLL
jgi:hypothetical protein